jgi:hypothetical protein
MSNLRTPRDPHAARAAGLFFLINEDRAELLRTEDEIRRGMVETFGFTEVKQPAGGETGGPLDAA